jgi:hypothetical protein
MSESTLTHTHGRTLSLIHSSICLAPKPFVGHRCEELKSPDEIFEIRTSVSPFTVDQLRALDVFYTHCMTEQKEHSLNPRLHANPSRFKRHTLS